ncbi:DMT family transporter [Staphylococcus sp. EZ-P03]|uniref:DMT family transporter n=1 Tax=Staphylococcus sp. EZ-P03 TaxID=2282739 RepID=UPI000DF740AB|nr:DMT family transporter [Staphylococcus sp. EZ-P03]
MKNNYLKGVLYCFISGIVFGAQWPVASRALHYIDPYFFTLIRYIIVGVILSIFLFVKEGVNGFKFNLTEFIRIFYLGTLAFCAYNFLVFAGQKMAGTDGTLLASLLMALIPMVSILILWITKKVFPGYITLILVLISFLGVLLVISKGNFLSILNDVALLPLFLICLSVLTWSLYTLGISDFKNWSSLKYTTLSCLFGNISSTLVILLLLNFDLINLPNISKLWFVKYDMLYMSVISGVVGVLMWNLGNKILTPKNGVLFMNLVPIVAFLIEIMLGYNITLFQVLGAIITIIAIV